MFSTQAFAQRPLIPISDVQSVTPANLANCNDTPGRLGDTVRVQGVVLNPGGQAQSASGRQIWIRGLNTSPGTFNTIGLREGTGQATTPDDMLGLVPGDTIEVVGIVQEFNGSGANPANDGESQLVPLNNGGVTVIGPYNVGSPRPDAVLVPISALHNSSGQNVLSTGEAYEGEFVELQNVTVTTVTYFSNNTRVSFIVRDAAGNRLEISDRFLAQRLPGSNPPGTFVAPNVGDVFTSIKGIIIHSKQCPTGTGASNRGYTINPFDASHYVKGASGPAVTALSNNPVVPAPNQPVTINATVSGGTDALGVPLTVSNVTLHYAAGLTGAYTTQAMTNASGNIWQATLPANLFSDGTYVRYYITVNNSASQTVTFPNVAATPNPENPRLFLVRAGNLTIRDIQYTPFQTGGNQSTGANGQAQSILAGQTVTTEGVVTASAAGGNLGYVFIQQENQPEYAGLWINGGASIANLTVGQKVTVTGTIEEYFNMTRMTAVTNVTPTGTGTINPVVVNSEALQSLNFQTSEKYESMLVTVQEAGANRLFVVAQNADAPNTNQGDWRVGPDALDASRGTRIITGRQDNSNFSSLNVGYVNTLTPPASWGTVNGTKTLVNVGDSFQSITGIAWYIFNNFKVAPRNNADLVGFIADAKALINNGVVTVYPNPAKDKLNFTFTKGGASFQAVITDLTGRVVAAQNNLMSNDQMSIANLTPGYYVVSVADANGTLVSRAKLTVVK